MRRKVNSASFRVLSYLPVSGALQLVVLLVGPERGAEGRGGLGHLDRRYGLAEQLGKDVRDGLVVGHAAGEDDGLQVLYLRGTAHGQDAAGDGPAGGRRGNMPVQYVLQATGIERLQEVLPEFMRKVYESPVFQMADVDLKFSKPEARIIINRDKSNLLGVSTRDIAQTLQYGLSGQRMGYFYMNGKQYEILAEINRQQRNKPADLQSIYVRSDKGEMIQLDNLIALEENVAPPQLYHYNRFLSATVSAGLAKGKTIGQGLDEMDRIAAETLGDDFRTALAGDSKEFRESSSSLMFAFLLAILLIYLILAAQFESFKDPLVIMLTVPLAIAGALVFMAANGQTMNIFSQIGIIMLIGLVAKNGILIVEFANQKQEAGIDKLHAIEEASLQRLRPILMTSASTILGLLPLTVATGEGANGRIAMGIAVVGGMVVSTLLTLYIVPAIYSYVSTDRSKKQK